jgi:hypothetical protein
MGESRRGREDASEQGEGHMETLSNHDANHIVVADGGVACAVAWRENRLPAALATRAGLFAVPAADQSPGPVTI